MAEISIPTPQNVRIDYELAGTGTRIISFFIDLALMLTVNFLVIYSLLKLPDEYLFTTELLAAAFSFIWLGFYTLIFEIAGNGQSPGKMATGIQVIRLNGERVTFQDYFSRWSMRLVDIYLSFGIIAAFVCSGNPNGQRLGDLLAGTTVIRKTGYGRFSLDDIIRLNEKNTGMQHIEYRQVIRFTDKDIVLIKNALYRANLYGNKAHNKLLEMLAVKTSEKMGLEKPPQDTKEFLNKVISDYIILSR